jgi:hypothetical protein
MNAQPNGRRGNKKPVDKKPAGSPSQLEAAMAERRAHLAATIDELAGRAQPKEIARRTSRGLRERIQGLTHTPDGDLRTERLAAVGAAVVVLAGVLALIRRRR